MSPLRPHAGAATSDNDAAAPPLVAVVVPAREQIEVTHQIIAVEERQLHVIEHRYQSGVRTRADVLQQQSNLASVRATLPPLQQQLANYDHALAALTGQVAAD